MVAESSHSRSSTEPSKKGGRLQDSVRLPPLDGWAPWVAVVIAVIVPTATLLVKGGVADEKLRRVEDDTAKMSSRQESIRHDISEIKLSLARLEGRDEAAERLARELARAIQAGDPAPRRRSSGGDE